MKLSIFCTSLLITATGAFLSPGILTVRKSDIGLSARFSSNRSSKLERRKTNFLSHTNCERPGCQSALLASDSSTDNSSDVVAVIENSTTQNDEDDSVQEKLKEKNLPASYVVLAVLLITFASNQWSRQALYYLCDFSNNADPFKHINAAIGFDKEQYASLASFGFTIVFALFSLFAGSASDRYDRNVVAALSCGVWSAATALQSFATGFNDLIPLRAVIGASQAFFNPAAYTLIAEIFPKKMIGSINGIFSSGIYLGGALASLSIILDGEIGWRSSLLVIGGLGLLISALCYFVVSEPRAVIDKANIKLNFPEVVGRTGSPVSAASASTSMEATVIEDKGSSDAVKAAISSLKEVLHSPVAKLLFSASMLRFCAGFSIAIWKAPFVFAKFPESASSFAGSNAAIVAGGGLLSSLIGGVVSDYLANPPEREDGVTSRPRARAWIPAVGSLLAAPLWAAFILAEDPAVAAACLLAEYLTAECWFGPTVASIFSVVPKDKRGTAQGFFSVLTAAGNIAPVAVGAFAGGQLGSYALGNVLICAVSGAYVASSLLFALAAIEEEKKITVEWEKINKSV